MRWKWSKASTKIPCRSATEVLLAAVKPNWRSRALGLNSQESLANRSRARASASRRLLYLTLLISQSARRLFHTGQRLISRDENIASILHRRDSSGQVPRAPTCFEAENIRTRKRRMLQARADNGPTRVASVARHCCTYSACSRTWERTNRGFLRIENLEWSSSLCA